MMSKFTKRLNKAFQNVKPLSLSDKMKFGSFEGLTIAEILVKQDPRYISWLLGEKIIKLDKTAFEYYEGVIKDFESRLVCINDTHEHFEECEWGGIFDNRE